MYGKTNLTNNFAKWIKTTKGGECRKWYGNNEDILDYGAELFNFNKSSLTGKENYFKENYSWTRITSSKASFRYTPYGSIPNMAGLAGYIENDKLNYILAFLNTKINEYLMSLVNPTLNFPPGTVASLPIIFNDNKKSQIDALVEQNIAISKDDWDSFETSWDFEQHPLIRFKTNDKIADSFKAWADYKEQRFNQLKANEEELNRLFIEIYGLQDEMTPEVADKNITVAKADEEREIKSLISYAVGCMFGRYSLDAKGLIYAGGDFDNSKYKTFEVDEDGIIPVLSEHYFTDDIVERFNKFVKAAFGERYYAENMAYIASVLSTKANKSPDQVLREYFIKDFYKDHVQMYQKRPIYWMFSSEKNAFNALIYLHRYNKDTVNLVLNDYLREYKNKLQGNINALNALANNGNTTSTLNKIALQTYLNEADDYERNILFPLATERKEIDLDDGVKVNYLKFGKALRNIGLKEKP